MTKPEKDMTEEEIKAVNLRGADRSLFLAQHHLEEALRCLRRLSAFYPDNQVLSECANTIQDAFIVTKGIYFNQFMYVWETIKATLDTPKE